MNEALMSLNELIQALTAMRDLLGENALVSVDLDFQTNEPDIIGTLRTGIFGDLFRVTKLENERPIFRMHGKRIVTERLHGFQRVSHQLLAGLDGDPFLWGDDEGRRFNAWKARRMGCTLITRNFAEDMDLIIKKGEEPVGRGLFKFGRTRQPVADLFIMECQAEPKPAVYVAGEVENE